MCTLSAISTFSPDGKLDGPWTITIRIRSPTCYLYTWASSRTTTRWNNGEREVSATKVVSTKV